MKFKFYQHLPGKNLWMAIMASLTIGTTSLAQTLQNPTCGNDPNKLKQQYPGFKNEMEAFEQLWRDYMANADVNSFERTASGKYIIPVVVHVIHQGGSENISRTQILSQLTAINMHFSMEAPGLDNINGVSGYF